MAAVKHDRMLYTIRAEVAEYPQDSWRTLQILSNQTVGELGAAVLAAFEAEASHLWNIRAKGTHYEHNADPEMQPFIEEDGFKVMDPDDAELGQLGLKIGDKMSLEYDYGTTWDFILTVAKMEAAPRTKQSTFPRIADGHGPRIVDDTDPFELHQLIEYQKAGESIADHPELQETVRADAWDWRYDDFDLSKNKKGFRTNYREIRDAYTSYANMGREQLSLEEALVQAMLKDLARLAVKSAAAGRAFPRARQRRPTKSQCKKLEKPRIYRFRFQVSEFPEDCWREVELWSEATIGDLAGAVLAAFDSYAGHLWNISYQDYRFYHYEEDADFYYRMRKPVHPVHAYSITLGELGLRKRSKMQMEYDYGTTWNFTLRVVDWREANKNDKKESYPKLVAGHGGPMLEDIPTYVAYDIIQCRANGTSMEDNQEIMDYIGDYFEDFEYPDFDLKVMSKDFQEVANQYSLHYSRGASF